MVCSAVFHRNRRAGETVASRCRTTQSAGPARAIPIAPSIPARKQGMAMQPEDADFAQAAVWRVKLPAGVDANRDLRLRVRYTGDVHRAYDLPSKLLADDFYHARASLKSACAATAPPYIRTVSC